MKRDAQIILLCVSLLVMIGIVMIYSSSAVYAYGKYADSMHFLKRYSVHLIIGLFAAIFCMSFSVKRISSSARWVMLSAIILLILVLVPGIGRQVGGARRWMRFVGVGFQPSEIAKFALILYLADMSARKGYIMQNLKYGFIPALLVIGLTGGLVLMEPDMGTCVSILFVGFVMLFISGVKVKHVLYTALGVFPVLIMAVVTEGYRLRRVLSFSNPWADAKGAGFQLIQSFIALGSGGFLGVGLGESRQKLFYLPESHTDFIFSIIGEELGFIGTFMVLLLFVALIWFILRISFKVNNKFASNVIFGVGVIIAFEVLVNIGVSLGLLPTKGLPLPFISYGGSSLIAHMAAIGIVLNMAREVE